MKIKARFRPIKFDLRRYKRDLEKHLTRELQEAARAWLHATVGTNPKTTPGSGQETFPVWTGASAATFLELASKVSFALSISPVVHSRIPLGKSRGTGELNVDARKGKYSFKYETTLEHLIENEHINANLAKGLNLKDPGPYSFILKGQIALKDVIKGVRLLDPLKYSKPGTVKNYG